MREVTVNEFCVNTETMDILQTLRTDKGKEDVGQEALDGSIPSSASLIFTLCFQVTPVFTVRKMNEII